MLFLAEAFLQACCTKYILLSLYTSPPSALLFTTPGVLCYSLVLSGDVFHANLNIWTWMKPLVLIAWKNRSQDTTMKPLRTTDFLSILPCTALDSDPNQR